MGTATEQQRGTDEGSAAVQSGPKVGPSGIPATGRVLLIWAILSLIGGGIGMVVGMLFGAPYYFGFFFGLTLIGLAGLFAVAAHISRYQDGGR